MPIVTNPFVIALASVIYLIIVLAVFAHIKRLVQDRDGATAWLVKLPPKAFRLTVAVTLAVLWPAYFAGIALFWIILLIALVVSAVGFLIGDTIKEWWQGLVEFRKSL